MATCISLEKSTACSAFNASSISTDSSVSDIYPFLQYVSNVEEFDKHLTDYVKGDYVKTKYQTLLGCSNVNLTDTSDYYARYTTTVICNGIVQNSKEPCGLTDEQSAPLCADTCALYATSEEEIAINNQTCDSLLPNYMDQVRADFTNCALPTNSVTGSCIAGEHNEPLECGFSSNLVGLCAYCATSSPNATDSCCVNSKAETRCSNVHIPTTSSMPALFTITATAAADSSNSKSGLSGGAIAGIVIGAVVGVALIAGLIFLLFICLRRRRNSVDDNVFNQPNPTRRGRDQMQMTTAAPLPAKPSFEPVPGGRVARMSALQDDSDDTDRRSTARGALPVAGSKYSDTYTSDSEGMMSSPEARSRRRPPKAGRRHGSLSSTSALGMEGDSSPQSGTVGQVSSPEGVASGQSEQLPYFRDYYSQDDIHPNEKVSVLWAYQPRAADEFELDRGDMLKVVGIWDDGWATGVRINERAEDFDPTHNTQRDSGVSNGARADSHSPPPARGEIKAFPLVCVCLPQHWRKIIDGDLHETASP